MKKFYEKVCKLEELIALILVAGIAVLVFVSALMRTIGHPLNWAQDVALIAFAWLIFLGSDVAMRSSRSSPPVCRRFWTSCSKSSSQRSSAC